MIDLKHLGELEAAATAGPWEAVDTYACWRVRAPAYCVCHLTTSYSQEPTDGPDAKLIAAARNALPDLIRELEAARRVIALVHKYTEHDTLVTDLHDALAAYDALANDEALLAAQRRVWP